MASQAAVTAASATASAVPNRIQRLDEAVVNRIAAGEVVHRPASAVKEMMENSLDAGSTSITVTLKDGGLKLLQITDNGHGIRKEDLGIVCERFTTSKLKAFNDLDHIQTYGFRGEALASITHVAHVTIMSMTAGSPNAWKAKYSDGKLVPFRPGAKATPVPCAGVRGTQITVTDMFYNVSTRRKALKSKSEELKRVLEVVSRYAIHFGSRGVSFTCKKHGQGLPALHTLKTNSTLQNIAAVYGSKLSQELVAFTAAEHWGDDGSAAADDSDEFSYKADGYISNANFNRATGIFLLFINDRLVSSAKLKRAFDNVYSEYLPRKRHAFVYLSIKLPSHHCDVNVHPTKNQVHFLHEEMLVQKLQNALSEKLKGANESRTFYTQALLPTVIGSPDRADHSSDDDTDGSQQPGAEALRGRYAISSSSSSSSSQESASRSQSQSSDPSPSPPAPAASRSKKRGIARSAGPRSSQEPTSSKRKKAANPSKMVRTDAKVTLVNSYFKSLRESADGNDGDAQSQTDSQSNSQRGAGPASAVQRILKRRGHGGCGGCPDCNSGESSDSGGGKSGDQSQAYSAVAAVDWHKAAAATQPARKASSSRRKRKEVPYPPIMLTSIENMLKHIAQRASAPLRKVIAEHVYIGAVNEELALLQFNTKMYLVNHWEMSKEYFYQRAIRNFSHFPRIALQPAASLAQLLEIAFSTADIHVIRREDAKSSSNDQDEEQDHTADIAEAVDLLVSKADMLDEYFRISITPDGQLESLPQLDPDVAHTPQLDGLPRFVYNLAFKVDWTSEQLCFRDLAEELAFLYSLLPVRRLKTQQSHETVHGGGGGGASETAQTTPKKSASDADINQAANLGDEPGDSFEDSLNPRAKQLLSQVLFPAFRNHLLPPVQWLNTHVFMEVACLQKLYRIFERC